MKQKNKDLENKSHWYRNTFYWLSFMFASAFVFGEPVSAATYNVPAQGSLASVCNQATSWGDVINIAQGSFYNGGECNLALGVKVIGAGKGQTIINTTIKAASSLPVANGSNEITGITFTGGARIISIARSNQKIHDNSMANSGYEGILVEGKHPGNFEWNGDMCNGRIPSESAMYCENDPMSDHYPEETDWADGLELYNNDLTDTNIKLYVIRGAKIHHNNIDNSKTGVSGVGHTSFWWNAVDFYNNTIIMDRNSWTHIAVEVWKIQNNTKFRDNWTNGWFSLLENAKGINTPYSWQITGNTFSSNALKGDVTEALETSYSSENVLIANNLFENSGSNQPYEKGIAIWGTGLVKNYTIRNNVFRNMNSGVVIQTDDNTRPFAFNGQDIKIYNNTFDNLGSVGVFVRDGKGSLTGLKLKNNIFNNANYGILVGYGGHDISGIEFTNNNLTNMRYSEGGAEVFDYNGGRQAFSVVSNNYSLDPSFAAEYKLNAGSAMIDKGVNLGQEYRGAAPDLGAHEYGLDIRVGSSGSGSNPDTGGDTGGGGNCNSLAFVSGSASPSSVPMNSTYTISCDYGLSNIRSIKAKNDIGECVWTGWNGNAALFQCNSGGEGSRKNSCFLISGTTENHCPITNSINDIIVMAEKRYGISDFSLLVTDWMKRLTNSSVDINSDGLINIRDLGIMMSKWQ